MSASVTNPEDPRFTLGLLADVFEVLENHGYVRPDHPGAMAHSLCDVRALVQSFEGRSAQT